jgi:signal transduction histidine kinase
MIDQIKPTQTEWGYIAWALLDDRAESVVLVDLQGKILFVNETAAMKYSEPVEKMIGSSIWKYIPSSVVEYKKILFNQAIRSGDQVAVRQSVDSRWIQEVFHPFRGDGEKIDGIVLCAWDITPLVIAQEKYKQATMELITAQEEERHRISRDLHDDIGQRMTALALKLRSLESKLEDGRNIAIDEIKIAIRDLETITKQTRQIFYQLHPPSLDSVALPKVLEAFCSSLESSSGITIDFNCEENFPELTELQTTVLYRFVQEGFANIVKHAAASHAWINLDYNEGDLNVSMEDDGIGYEPGRDLVGLGLRGLEERFKMLDGSFEVESSPGKGTHIFGTMPITRKEVNG